MTAGQSMLWEFDPAWAFDGATDETAPIHLPASAVSSDAPVMPGRVALQICWYPQRWSLGAPIYGNTVWEVAVSPLANELILAAYHFPALTTPMREGVIEAGIDLGPLPAGTATLLLTRKASDPRDTLAGDAIVTRACLTYARARRKLKVRRTA